MRTLTKDLQAKISPQQALELLKEGNKRFVQNLKVNRNLLQQVNETRDGQWPFAVVLSCIDSRTSAELIFDQGLGDIFSIRIAGNVVNEDVLGSMEFACQIAGAKLILVLGHTKCGAVKGACNQVKMGHLTGLLAKINPAIQAAQSTYEHMSYADLDFIEHVTKINFKRSVVETLERSDIVRQLVEAGMVGVAGALYDVATGQVEFYEETVIIK